MRRPLLLLLVLALGAAVIATVFLLDAAERQEDAGASPPANVEAPIVPPAETQPSAESGDPRRKPVQPGPGRCLIRARLVDPDGQPVAGGFLLGTTFRKEEALERGEILPLLIAAQGGPLPEHGLLQAESQPDGRVELLLPQTEDGWLLAARAPGYSLAFRPLSASPGQTEFELGDIRFSSAARFEVSVVDQAGAALPGATVLLYRGGLRALDEGELPAHALETDAEGLARFTHLPGGEFHLLARAPGRVRHEEQGLSFLPGRTLQRRIVLEPGGKIRGRVLEAGGEPAAGIEVVVRERREDSHDILGFSFLWLPLGEDPAVHRTETDAKGVFQIGGLPEGALFDLRARRSPEAQAEKKGLRPGEMVILTLPAEAAVRGRLVTAEGAPAGGARFAFLSGPGHGLKPGSRRSAEPDGRFSQLLLAGRYRLAVWHPSGETVFESPGLVEQGIDLGDLALPLGGGILVRAVGPDGQPVPRFQMEEVEPEGDPRPIVLRLAEDEVLTLRGEDDDRQILRQGRGTATAGAEGSLRLAGLPPGLYRFRITAPGFSPAIFQTEVRSGQLQQQQIRLLPGAELEIELLHADGRPAPGKRLHLRPADGKFRLEDTASEKTDEQGRARFADLPPASYEVSEKSAIFGGPVLGSIELIPGPNRLQLFLQPEFPLTVRVLDADGPVAGAAVRALSPEAGFIFLDGLFSGGPPTTGEDGRVTLRSMKAGEYEISATRPGSAPARTLFDLSGPGQQAELRFDGVVVEGRVLHAPAGSTVELEKQASLGDLAAMLGGSEKEMVAGLLRSIGKQLPTTTRCDAEGRFRFRNVAAGDYSLSVEAEGSFLPGPVTVSVREEPVRGLELVMEAEGRLALRVSGMPEGSGIGYLAEAEPEEGQMEAEFFDQDGLYRFRRLRPGSLRLLIRRQEGSKKPLAVWQIQIDAERDTIIDWSPPAR